MLFLLQMMRIKTDVSVFYCCCDFYGGGGTLEEEAQTPLH